MRKLPSFVVALAVITACAVGGSTDDMQTAYASASADDNFDAPQNSGGCASARNEYGTWSIVDSVIGAIACPINNNNGVDLVWDDPRTNIIAVVNADFMTPMGTYSWWQANGASIDGSTQTASTS